MHTFSLDAPLPDHYWIDKLLQELTQLQSHSFRSQSARAAGEGGRMGFAYSRCSGPYGCTEMTRCSMGGRCPLTGPSML